VEAGREGDLIDEIGLNAVSSSLVGKGGNETGLHDQVGEMYEAPSLGGMGVAILGIENDDRVSVLDDEAAEAIVLMSLDGGYRHLRRSMVRRPIDRERLEAAPDNGEVAVRPSE
jgi:hypothetical protein